MYCLFFIHLSVHGHFSSVQSLSRVRLFATPRIAACQASLSITNSQSSLKLMCIESVMPSSHLILCCPLLLLPPIPPSIRVFSNDSALCMRWPSCLHILAVVNNAAMGIGVHISFQISGVFWFFFQNIYPGVDFLGHLMVLFLVF